MNDVRFVSGVERSQDLNADVEYLAELELLFTEVVS